MPETTPLQLNEDTRASYAQLTRRRGAWRAGVIRLDYDRRQARPDSYETGFVEELVRDFSRRQAAELGEKKSDFRSAFGGAALRKSGGV